MKLTRPVPKLPHSYFWTWDHSTNWVLDDPGTMNFGCQNRYLKKPDTFVEDYRRLTDFAADIGIEGIAIWGFLRDSHHGIEGAKRVASYGAEKGVRIMPGVGTSQYGGVYYEGEHPYNLDTLLRDQPQRAAIAPEWIREDGQVHSLCPSHPQFAEWIQEGMEWLFRTFEIGGCNLENGDFFRCFCPSCREKYEHRQDGDSEFFHFQKLGYEAAFNAAKKIQENNAKELLITWATYCGFVPGGAPDATDLMYTPQMHCQRPSIFQAHPEHTVQWSLTGMIHQTPLPLYHFWEDGTPSVSTERWPEGLTPPSQHNVGYLHQGSQWCHIPRYELAISSIKEGCLCAWKVGFEGVVIQGEVTPQHIPTLLNYLAFSHFTHWPEDSIRRFGMVTLGEVLGSERAGEVYARGLCELERTPRDQDCIQQVFEEYQKVYPLIMMGNREKLSGQLIRFQMWNWLYKAMNGERGANWPFY